MKLPKNFTLGAVEWSVTETASVPNAVGYCEPNSGNILVQKSLSPDLKLWTFTHELTHAILFSMGKQMPHDEEFVDGFANFLAQYLKTNK
jgi:Zn-dependent peptidase ImmA (M78 family)